MPLKQVNLRQPERLVRKCSALKGRQKKQGNLRQLSLRLLLSRWAVTVGYLWPDLPYILVNMFITNVHGFSSNYNPWGSHPSSQKSMFLLAIPHSPSPDPLRIVMRQRFTSTCWPAQEVTTAPSMSTGDKSLLGQRPGTLLHIPTVISKYCANSQGSISQRVSGRGPGTPPHTVGYIPEKELGISCQVTDCPLLQKETLPSLYWSVSMPSIWPPMAVSSYQFSVVLSRPSSPQ